MKVFLSEKQIIKTNEFLYNYYGLIHNKKLTHQEMNLLLMEKGKKTPQHINYAKLQKENILSGDCIAVKDRIGQIIIYKNPLRENLNLLLEELKSKVLEKKIECLKNVKQTIQNETEEEFELKGNRYKKFYIRNNRIYRKNHY